LNMMFVERVVAGVSRVRPVSVMASLDGESRLSKRGVRVASSPRREKRMGESREGSDKKNEDF
jgi:hypothetical protein